MHTIYVKGDSYRLPFHVLHEDTRDLFREWRNVMESAESCNGTVMLVRVQPKAKRDDETRIMVRL